MVSRRSGGTPSPLSRTVMVTWPSAAAQASDTFGDGAARLASSAFFSRLITACSKRPRSASRARSGGSTSRVSSALAAAKLPAISRVMSLAKAASVRGARIGGGVSATRR